jgi:hypothetical protein
VRAVLISIVVLAVTPACAQAFAVESSQSEKGWIKLTVRDAAGATRVNITEAGNGVADVVPDNGQAVVRHAAAWRCDRLERTFTATASYPDVPSDSRCPCALSAVGFGLRSATAGNWARRLVSASIRRPASPFAER